MKEETLNIEKQKLPDHNSNSDTSCELCVLGTAKKYNIIYADPPWSYGGRKLNAATDGKELNDHYPTMEIDEICALPVKQIADKNCLLFMWVVYAQLENAFKVINAWGFKYSTVAFEWVKQTETGKNVCFMGAWTTGGALELCLLARRGSVKRKDKTVKRLHVQRGRHSQKPDEIRKEIVRLCGDLPRVELFARTKADGWDVWGNELENTVELVPKHA